MRFYSFCNFNILLLFRSPGTLSAKLKNVSSVLWFPSKKSFIPGQKLLLELLLKLVCIYSDDNIWALFTVHRPLSRFGTHFQAWLGRKCARSRRSYGKVGDFGQSNSARVFITWVTDVHQWRFFLFSSLTKTAQWAECSPWIWLSIQSSLAATTQTVHPFENFQKALQRLRKDKPLRVVRD